MNAKVGDEAQNVEALDLIWGARSIAKLIGRSTRATHYLLINGKIPAKRIGGRYCVSRRELLSAFGISEG